jgi:hypothetical protein
MTKSFPLARFLAVSAALIAAFLASPAFAQQPLYPNLEPLPAYDLGLRPDFMGGTELVFSTLTKNSGRGPLEVVAGELTGEELQDIFQRIYWDDGTFEDVLAGTFVFHDEHGHIHVEDYSEYILEMEDAPGDPVRLGQKTSFCLLDTDKIDRKLPGAPKRPVYSTCDDLQGISVGWGDAYHYNLPGQNFDVTDLETGYYLLTIVTDPANQLVETDETDNTSTIRIYLDMEALTVDGVPGDGGGPTDPPGDVEVESMLPATMFAGTDSEVTIKGSGFSQGISVSLANGSGPAPRFSNVVVHDENTITATITAKSGGPPRIRVWDLKVGPESLSGALTVFP